MAILSAAAMALMTEVAIAQGTIEQQQACQKDTFRLCRDAVPDETKVRVCLIQHRTQLSEECRATMVRQRRRPGGS